MILLLRFVLYALISLVVFMLSTYITVTLLLKDISSVPCPNLIGKDVEEAKAMLSGDDFILSVDRREKRKDILNNRIIAQKPEPGMPVKPGRAISVVAADGPSAVTIPMLIDHNLAYAQEVLSGRGIRIKRVLHAPAEEADKVIGQFPKSGDNILDEEGMTLVVGARDKQYYVMPELRGRSAARILEELQQKGIPFTLNGEVGQGAPGMIQISVPAGAVFGDEEPLDVKVNPGG